MITGTRIQLRPLRDADWPLFEAWGGSREALWGPFQRFQLDHLPALRQAYQHSGLLARENGFLLIEMLEDQQVVGFVRYTMQKFPDADFPHPEVGFGITDVGARGQGLAKEAVGLLATYLFSGYAVERLSAFTDCENLPARNLLEGLGFELGGTLRKAYFRDGGWRDMAIYGLLREAWTGAQVAA